MSRPGGARGAPVPSAARRLRVLTFEAGAHLLGVAAEEVDRIVTSDGQVPEGARVVDAVGLLSGAASPRACLIVLSAPGGSGGPVAVTASRACEVVEIETGRLLPLPGCLFARENPFAGLAPMESGEGTRALFVLAGADRLLAAAA